METSITFLPQRSLYLRWVAVNALGEMFGLGLTLLIGVLYFTWAGEPSGMTALLLAFGVSVSSGVVEATVVGLAQWWAMRPWFPGVTRGAWWRGTLLGALLAYILGYLPSTIMDLSQATAPDVEAAPMAEPSQVVVLLLAAGLGLAGGALLSFAQGLALRGKVRRWKTWIPANMLAWAAGMPLIFWGVDRAYTSYAAGNPAWQVALFGAAVLLVTGAVVGAIHGAFLVRMVEPPALSG